MIVILNSFKQLRLCDVINLLTPLLQIFNIFASPFGNLKMKAIQDKRMVHDPVNKHPSEHQISRSVFRW